MGLSIDLNFYFYMTIIEQRRQIDSPPRQRRERSAVLLKTGDKRGGKKADVSELYQQPLTEREKRVLESKIIGLSTPVIAQSLTIGEREIASDLGSAFDKLGASTLVGAALKGVAKHELALRTFVGDHDLSEVADLPYYHHAALESATTNTLQRDSQAVLDIRAKTAELERNFLLEGAAVQLGVATVAHATLLFLAYRFTHLTAGELDVLQKFMLSRQLGSIEQVADTLHVSKNTVKTHLNHVYGKLGVPGIDEAVSILRGMTDQTDDEEQFTATEKKILDSLQAEGVDIKRVATLSPMERSILYVLYKENSSTDELIKRYNISINTLKTHIRHALIKLGVSNRHHAALVVHAAYLEGVAEPPEDLLTDRQRQVLLFSGGSLNNVEIGREIGISAETVRVHLQKGRGKLNQAANTISEEVTTQAA
jgi:DNA-binding CsgD family transcriptional regulator